ncbi:MAG TPA: NUDIX domain-containing protein [Microlunatus sp.]|nr:NUDIX domain-containing protein [Microlunatus sp.]
MVYRDASGRALTDYPRPSVAVDTAVLTVRDGRLQVVLVSVAGRRGLPGTFLHEGELLADAVRRALCDKTGITGVEPRQLHVFDALDRDDRGRVLSVAHRVAVAEDRLAGLLADADLVPVDQVRDLRYDHEEIIDRAVSELRGEYHHRPDPAGLLDEPFTLLELQRLHEAVAGRDLMRDTFRRRMQPQLIGTGQRARGVVGKPAEEFARGAYVNSD